ncbi:MAG: leucyl/phenylalanyl-tRNA--protein transferase [Armatimonadota bacterium]|nr:leucyl/phenylalanyl-tRNA--protein transferase [Armatimonadota bacterium]
MAGSETGKVDWYKPYKRAIIPIDGFHASRSMKKSARKYEICFDRDFDAIVDGCGSRDETWISPEIKAACRRLFDEGHAHCCGAYRELQLVGGVYTVAFGAAMFAESMFHTETDAGKVALWHMVENAKQCGYGLFEVQFLTPHLETLGAIEIEDERYFSMLERALEKHPKPLVS